MSSEEVSEVTNHPFTSLLTSWGETSHLVREKGDDPTLLLGTMT